jgi:hypothetical protein
VVIAALVMTGFFYIHHVQESVHVKIKVTGPEGIADSFTNGFITTSLDDHRDHYLLNQNGEAYLWNLKPGVSGQSISIKTSIPGYQQDKSQPTYTLKPEDTIYVATITDPEPNMDKLIPDAIGKIGDEIGYKFTPFEEKFLQQGLLRAFNLVKPEWIYYRNHSTGLVSKIGLVPVDGVANKCRGAEWHLNTSAPSDAVIFVTACHTSQSYWVSKFTMLTVFHPEQHHLQARL